MIEGDIGLLTLRHHTKVGVAEEPSHPIMDRLPIPALQLLFERIAKQLVFVRRRPLLVRVVGDGEVSAQRMIVKLIDQDDWRMLRHSLVLVVGEEAKSADGGFRE